MSRVAWLVCGGLVLGGVSLPGMLCVCSVHHSTPMRTLAHAMRVLEWSMHIGWWFLAGWTLTLTLCVLKLAYAVHQFRNEVKTLKKTSRDW